MGCITGRDEMTHVTVEIEFADTSRRRIVFADFSGISMAALSEGGAAFAGKTSVSFRPFFNWTQTQEWSYPLLEGEEVVACAAGLCVRLSVALSAVSRSQLVFYVAVRLRPLQ